MAAQRTGVAPAALNRNDIHCLEKPAGGGQLQIFLGHHPSDQAMVTTCLKKAWINRARMIADQDGGPFVGDLVGRENCQLMIYVRKERVDHMKDADRKLIFRAVEFSVVHLVSFRYLMRCG